MTTGSRQHERSLQRVGSLNRLLVLSVASVVAISGLAIAALQLRPEAKRADRSQLVRLYCAAGVAQPVESIVKEYNRIYGSRIQLVRTGGSGELAGQIRTEYETGLRAGADLYLTADDVLLEKAASEGVIAEAFPVAVQRPVIAIRADSPLKLDNLSQLLQHQSLKFGIAGERAAVGKLIRQIADREGQLEALETRRTGDFENVMTLAQALVAGSLDVAIIWDTTVNQLNQAQPQPQLKIAAMADSNDQLKSDIGIGVVASSQNPTAALRFCRFLVGSEVASREFKNYGFEVVAGDRWEEVPEIHLYCGSMFTPVLEETVRQFAQREGVNVYPRWQGCGKLVASMEGTQDPELFPDAFLACDVSFLKPVQDRFDQPELLSSNDIVIAVSDKARSQVRRPEDLLASGRRVGICDPEQSALGRLTEQLLTSSPYEGWYPKLQQTASVTVDVGPTLVSQLMAGGLDAAIVYRSNVLADERAANSVTLIEFDSDLARAVQSWSIARETQNRQLMQRFHTWMDRPEIRQRFSQYGFSQAD